MGGERDFAPKMNPGRATPGASPEATLLEVVAGLMRESRPAAGELPVPRLDSLLERELGFDSLARLELLMRIQRRLGVTVAEDKALAAETPRELVDALGGAPALRVGAAKVAPATPGDEIVEPREARALWSPPSPGMRSGHPSASTWSSTKGSR